MYVTTETAAEFANSREISNEIAQAILEMANDEEQANAIWEDPDNSAYARVVARAWELADAEETELFWGGRIAR